MKKEIALKRRVRVHDVKSNRSTLEDKEAYLHKNEILGTLKDTERRQNKEEVAKQMRRLSQQFELVDVMIQDPPLKRKVLQQLHRIQRRASQEQIVEGSSHRETSGDPTPQLSSKTSLNNIHQGGSSSALKTYKRLKKPSMTANEIKIQSNLESVQSSQSEEKGTESVS